MISLLASVRAGGGLDRVDHAVQSLEDEWRQHGDVPLDRFWTEQKRQLESDSGESTVMLTELVRTDLRCRFARGQTPRVADYLERFPQLESANSRVLSLIYEEFCLAEERGNGVDVDSFCQRYPRWKDSLVSQLQYHHLFSEAAGARPKLPPFPEEGQTFEEFQLISMLGRGGTSRVFLARDLSLGGKQVVLKVSLDRGREPQAQGALDHPHIVPVNSVVFSDEGMRGLSMPYRQGLPLDEVIRRVQPASKPARAMALWEALVLPSDRAADSTAKAIPLPQPEIRAPGPRGDGWDGFPLRGTYAQGVAWIVKIVAEALHYAHGQQTFHRDVKPANVLLTLQHGPQLLDFNLAESPHSASQAQAAMHGGTLPYMAPEQIEAFLNPDLWGKVGAQADVYSLGLVLRELLTGQAPDLPAGTMAPARAMRVLLDRRPLLDVSVRGTNLAIPHALEAIVAKCLAVATEERFTDAGALAEDLRRFLEHRPLLHAVNPSRRERSANWAFQNRRRLTVGAACLLTAFVTLAIDRFISARRPTGPIETSKAFLDALALFDDGHAADSIKPFERLKRLYPDSPLPGIYLALAYDHVKRDGDADRAFDEALQIGDAERQLVRWGRVHPSLADQFTPFKKRRDDRAAAIEDNPDLAAEDRSRQAEEQHRLAGRALKIANAIRPERPGRKAIGERLPVARENADIRSQVGSESEWTEYNLALNEQEDKEYESVIQRADRSIELTRSRQPSNDMIEDSELEEYLYKWRRLRSRALTKRAERSRAEGTTAAREEALKDLASAYKDLHVCSNFATKYSRSLELHSVQRVWAEALMTRVEIDIDLGRLAAARVDLKYARDGLTRYDAIAQKLDRKYELGPFFQRMKEIDKRLRQEEARRSAEVTASGATGDR
jgi:serine/threonine protein kinase